MDPPHKAQRSRSRVTIVPAAELLVDPRLLHKVARGSDTIPSNLAYFFLNDDAPQPKSKSSPAWVDRRASHNYYRPQYQFTPEPASPPNIPPTHQSTHRNDRSPHTYQSTHRSHRTSPQTTHRSHRAPHTAYAAPERAEQRPTRQREQQHQQQHQQQQQRSMNQTRRQQQYTYAGSYQASRYDSTLPSFGRTEYAEAAFAPTFFQGRSQEPVGYYQEHATHHQPQFTNASLPPVSQVTPVSVRRTGSVADFIIRLLIKLGEVLLCLIVACLIVGPARGTVFHDWIVLAKAEGQLGCLIVTILCLFASLALIFMSPLTMRSLEWRSLDAIVTTFCLLLMFGVACAECWFANCYPPRGLSAQPVVSTCPAPEWIAAAIFCFIALGVFVADILHLLRLNILLTTA